MIGNQHNKKSAHLFAAAFAESLSSTLAGAIGSAWPLEIAGHLQPASTKQTPVHFRVTVASGLHGECFVEIYEDQVTEIIAKIRKAPAEPLKDEHVEEIANVIASATQALATSLMESYGEVVFKVDRVAELAFGGMFVVPLVNSADAAGTPILLYLDGDLLDALSSPAEGTEKKEDEGGEVHPHNLKLVMDVELNVSLRFGQCQLPLREVLELASGSVIELDRMVDEPVDLLLDGKLIARGEAVIVDGNYGLRVTEIPQPVATHFVR